MEAHISVFPAFLVGWVKLIVPQSCSDELFVKFNLQDDVSFKAAISKIFGYAIISGSCIVKIPQILKIFKSKSGKGISVSSVSCDLLAVSATWSYSHAKSFPFSAYGEALFLAIQTVLISFLVMHYSGKTSTGLISVVVYAITMRFLLSPLAPMPLLSALQACNLAAVVMSKVIQARTNYLNGGTGQLSLITVLLLFMGSVIRIFTSIRETGDILIILTFALSSFVKGIVLAQIVYYWDARPIKKIL